MRFVPEGLECAVALGISVDVSGDQATAMLSRVKSLAEDLSLCVQFFAGGDANVAELAELALAGHAVDWLIPEVVLVDGSAEKIGAALAGGRAALDESLPTPVVGARAAEMVRIGIQKEEALQGALLRAGLKYVSTDYSTKAPEDPASPGFADKNAAMLIKHTQPRRYPSGLFEIPAAGYSDIEFFCRQRRGLDAWLGHLGQCLDFAYDMGGLLFAPDLHLSVIERFDPGMDGIRVVVERARGKKLGDVGFVTLRDAVGWTEG